MFARLVLVMALLSLVVAGTVAGQEVHEQKLWDWLMVQSSKTDFEQLEPFRAVHILLSIAESCDTFQQKALADKYLKRALRVADKDKARRHHFRLFKYAVKVDNLALAEKFAQESAADALLDRWDLERLRRGDRRAIKDYPRGEMTLFNAMELSQVYVELGDYKAAEEFVTDVKITEENDPRAVTGMIFEEIARRYREKGDMENAKRYIDKAMAVGGRLFYTGYAIEVAHRSIHGKLTEDLEPFAQRGAKHPAHMGRELVQVLAYELIRTGHFEEAKRTARLLKQKEDVHSCMKALAVGQATRGDITAALKTVDELQDPLARNRARLGIATVLAEKGNSKTARKLADFVLRGLKEQMDKEAERHCQQLARLYGTLRCQAEIEQIVALASTPLLKANCLSQAIQGFTASAAK